MGAGSSGSTVPGFVGCTLKRRAMAFFFFFFYILQRSSRLLCGELAVN